MLLALLLLAAPREDLATRLRHLDSAAEAWDPSPAPDASRIAFLTTLFGSAQAASMSGDGGYPVQLTDEPGGVLAVRTMPGEQKQLVALVQRAGRRRLVLLDEQAAPPVDVDPAPGDQFMGGFARDGRKFFYATVDGEKFSLGTLELETQKRAQVTPEPSSAGAAQKPGSMPLGEALQGLVALGPPAPDARSILAVVQRGQGEALVLIDLVTARGEWLTPKDKPARFSFPHFSPDGKLVYVLTDLGRPTLGVDTFETAEKHARKTVYAPPLSLQAFALSDDGHRLAVATESNGQTIFSLLALPSLHAQPLAAPPGGSLAPVYAGEQPLRWDRASERLYFAWQLADDVTDVWELRLGYGVAMRLTRSPRPGLLPDSIPRPKLLQVNDHPAWLWMPARLPADEEKPRVAVLVAAGETRPVFDKRVTALNEAGLAVLAVNGPSAQKAALAYLASAPDLDAHEPLLLDLGGLPVEEPARWSGVVSPPGLHRPGLTLDPEHPDLEALVRYARRGAGAL